MIGYYVHHHGSGHLHRALSVAQRVGGLARRLADLTPALAEADVEVIVA